MVGILAFHIFFVLVGRGGGQLKCHPLKRTMQIDMKLPHTVLVHSRIMSTSSKDGDASASSANSIEVTANYWFHVTSVIGNALTAKSQHIVHYEAVTAVCFMQNCA